MTLRHRLLLVYGAGGAVPLLLLAGLGLGLLARTIQAQVDRDVRRTAAAAADLLHARIHYYLQEAVQISPYRSVYAARLEA